MQTNPKRIVWLNNVKHNLIPSSFAAGVIMFCAYHIRIPFSNNPIAQLMVGLKSAPKWLGCSNKVPNLDVPTLMPSLTKLFQLGVNAPFSNEDYGVSLLEKYYFMPLAFIALFGYILYRIYRHWFDEFRLTNALPPTTHNQIYDCLLILEMWLLINFTVYYSRTLYFLCGSLFGLAFVALFFVFLGLPIAAIFEGGGSSYSSGFTVWDWLMAEDMVNHHHHNWL